jgi:hypothetical protein
MTSWLVFSTNIPLVLQMSYHMLKHRGFLVQRLSLPKPVNVLKHQLRLCRGSISTGVSSTPLRIYGFRHDDVRLVRLMFWEHIIEKRPFS